MKDVKTLKCEGVWTNQKINIMGSTLATSAVFYLFVVLVCLLLCLGLFVVVVFLLFFFFLST